MVSAANRALCASLSPPHTVSFVSPSDMANYAHDRIRTCTHMQTYVGINILFFFFFFPEAEWDTLQYRRSLIRNCWRQLKTAPWIWHCFAHVRRQVADFEGKSLPSVIIQSAPCCCCSVCFFIIFFFFSPRRFLFEKALYVQQPICGHFWTGALH